MKAHPNGSSRTVEHWKTDLNGDHGKQRRSRRLGIAVIGCGYWGSNHVRVFSELERSRVLMACDLSPERLKPLSIRFPHIRLTTDLNDVFSDPRVEAVVISTEADSHARLARRCLQAGKHVLVEKPITTSASAAAGLIELARERARVLMVGHTFVYNAGVQKVRQIIEDGKVGRVYYAYSSRTNLGPIRRDVDAIWDLAPHDIAIFDYLFGKSAEWVSAVSAGVLRSGAADAGFISLGYPDGVLGHIHVSWVDPHKMREVVVVGSDARIAFNDLNPFEPVRVVERSVAVVADEVGTFGEHQLRIRDGDSMSPRIAASEPLKNQARHFIECIRENLTPISDGQAGLAVVRVMQAIDESLARGGAPVRVNQHEGPTWSSLSDQRQFASST